MENWVKRWSKIEQTKLGGQISLTLGGQILWKNLVEEWVKNLGGKIGQKKRVESWFKKVGRNFGGQIEWKM